MGIRKVDFIKINISRPVVTKKKIWMVRVVFVELGKRKPKIKIWISLFYQSSEDCRRTADRRVKPTLIY